MKTIRFLALPLWLGLAATAAVLLLSTAASSQGKGISGHWVAPYDHEGKVIDLALNLSASGNTVAGEMTNFRSGMMKIEKGTIDGNNIRFECSATGSDGVTYKLQFAGEIVGDHIKLTLGGDASGRPPLEFHRGKNPRRERGDFR